MPLVELSCNTVHPKAYTIKYTRYNVHSRKRLRWEVDDDDGLVWTTVKMKASNKQICTQLHQALEVEQDLSKWKKMVHLMKKERVPDIIYASIPDISPIEGSVPSSAVNTANRVDTIIVQRTKVSVGKVIGYSVLGLFMVGATMKLAPRLAPYVLDAALVGLTFASHV